MSELSTDIVVVGAGVIGLAVARRFAIAGLEVLLVEKEATFGTGTSSRNSEVIHAGLYYPSESLKARLCLPGREKLYEYCRERGVPYKQLGKLVVATTADEVMELEAIQQQALENGCEEVHLLGHAEFKREQGALSATAMLLSPRTGIVDSHQLMLSLLGDFERHSGLVAWRTEVKSIGSSGQSVSVNFGLDANVNASCVINAAGLGASGLLGNSEKRYGVRLAKGDYFAYSGKIPFGRLVYPVPQRGGLGVHLTLDMNGAARFGPDVTWVDEIDYSIESSKRDLFFTQIQKYWPGCESTKLCPSYSGIRPKVTFENELLSDFAMVWESDDAQSKIMHLLGIESPGLTSCLSVADYVFNQIY